MSCYSLVVMVDAKGLGSNGFVFLYLYYLLLFVCFLNYFID